MEVEDDVLCARGVAPQFNVCEEMSFFFFFSFSVFLTTSQSGISHHPVKPPQLLLPPARGQKVSDPAEELGLLEVPGATNLLMGAV